MGNKILSIVIPAYNVEQYIERCLNSVVCVKELDEIEVLVINDGSKDHTLDLSLKYAHKYPDSVKVIDKSNGGWGTAINKGIELATGKYVKTLDSDDWFNSGDFDKFIVLLKQLDVDLVLTALSTVNSSGEVCKTVFAESLCGKVMAIEDYLMENNSKMDAPIHSITYRTSMLKEMRFKVCDRYYADLDYIITPLLHVNTVYLSRLNIYQYYVGRPGQSISIEGYNAHLDDYLAVCDKAISFWKENNSKFSIHLRKFMFTSTCERVIWAYKLLLKPIYSGKCPDSKAKLDWLESLVKSDKLLYTETNKVMVRKIIPWLYIWRKTRINIFR